MADIDGGKKESVSEPYPVPDNKTTMYLYLNQPDLKGAALKLIKFKQKNKSSGQSSSYILQILG